MEEAGNRNTCLTLSMKEDFLGVDSTLTGAAGSETEVCLDAISALVDVTGSRTEKCLGAISALANAICSKLEDLLGAVSALADATLMEMTSSVLITELGNTSLADTSVTGITPGFLTASENPNFDIIHLVTLRYILDLQCSGLYYVMKYIF